MITQDLAAPEGMLGRDATYSGMPIIFISHVSRDVCPKYIQADIRRFAFSISSFIVLATAEVPCAHSESTLLREEGWPLSDGRWWRILSWHMHLRVLYREIVMKVARTVNTGI